MPALPKPHRIAVLVPEVTIEGPDAAYEREASILMWTACLETCQRHPRLSVLEAEATPLFPQDGHFAPQHVDRGARPGDAFFGPTRRDELIWLELTLGTKPSVVRLHAIGRDGKQESFDALGRNTGEQIQQVLGAWLTARNLGVLPRPFEAVTAEEVLAVLRVVAPTLAEQARAWSLPVASAPTWSLASVPAEASEDAFGSDSVIPVEPVEGSAPNRNEEAAVESTIDSTIDIEPASEGPRSSLSRPVVHRLPPLFRVPALRLLELALREELTDQLALADPDRAARREREPAAGKGLAYVAATGMAALRRPATLEVLERAALALLEHGRIDEAERLLERAVAFQDENPRAHLALLDVHRANDRIGAWLERARRSSAQHGCPMDPVLPWYPDQIHIDLRGATALMHAGLLDEAIALRANRLDGRATTWPAQTRVLEQWRKDPRFVAWCYAREGAFRGEVGRALEGFGRIEPEDSVDVALLLDALVALGREEEAVLAWAQFGLGRGYTGAVARIAAVHALMAAREWRRGLEELWRVSLCEPGRDEHVAIARLGCVLSAAPIEVIETALGDRIAIGAHTLARRMARDASDFVPLAAKSGLVERALGKRTAVDFDPVWLGGFSADTRSRRAIDQLFAELGKPRKIAPSGFDIGDELQRGDRLVNRWLEVAFTEASEDDRAALAQAAAYTAAQALGRYLSLTTHPPSAMAGALRLVAAEALALLRKHRAALDDRDARALLGALDPLLRRVDRWISAVWLGAVERAIGLDERSGGNVYGFVRDLPVVAARILGPEETAVLSHSIAQLHRERPTGWAAKVAAQASWLASHTGCSGLDEWADATVAQLEAREIELEDAIDSLHTACYLAEGKTAGPCVQAARTLFGAGRAPSAFAVLSAGLRAADPRTRETQLAALAPVWKTARIDVPLERPEAAAAAAAALQSGDAARAEKLARWVAACDPDSAEAQRNLGLAFAHQGRVAEALHHLVRGLRDQATGVLAEMLTQAGREMEAVAVLDYASRWYVSGPQWLAFGDVAHAARDRARTAKAYALAYQLEPKAFDARQLDAYATVLRDIGDHAACEQVAEQMMRVADAQWQWRATEHLEAARAGVKAAPAPATVVGGSRERVFQLLEIGDHAAAADLLTEPGWRVRVAALQAARFRFPAENHVDVTPRARTAAVAVLADTTGTMDRDALLARALALRIREQAYFARDPVPRLGDRLTREAFYREFRARGGVVIGDAGPPPPAFVDRIVVPDSKIARTSDYVALLRDLASMPPLDALAQRGLDNSAYLELARAWAVAMDRDPSIAKTIEAGLAAARPAS